MLCHTIFFLFTAVGSCRTDLVDSGSQQAGLFSYQLSLDSSKLTQSGDNELAKELRRILRDHLTAELTSDQKDKPGTELRCQTLN